MKTNISIELTDEERLNLAQKYNNTTKNEWDLVPDGPRKFYGLY